MNKPLCFVLMPFGQATNSAGASIDFDAVYREQISPALEAAGLAPVRATEELVTVQQAAYEQLLFCEYAVLDLSNAQASACYALGLRHALRPGGTGLIYAEGSQPPFAPAALAAIAYSPAPADPAAALKSLTESFSQLRQNFGQDLPSYHSLYQLLEDFLEVGHTKTDVFRDRVAYSAQLKEQLAQARQQGSGALRKLGAEMLQAGTRDAGVLIDLMLSYRAAKAWQDVIALVQQMPLPLARTVMVQEQLGFALNRAGQSAEAERRLLSVLAQHGPSSETYSLLGRVYKDRWEQTLKRGATKQAQEILAQAIDAYRRGFETDWRDGLPGINTVTLMELSEPPDPQREQLIPVVTYAVERRIATGTPDYWDYATLIELAVLGKNEAKAKAALTEALAHIREVWEPETTARNLRLIREVRARRQESLPWAELIEAELERKAKT